MAEEKKTSPIYEIAMDTAKFLNTYMKQRQNVLSPAEMLKMGEAVDGLLDTAHAAEAHNPAAMIGDIHDILDKAGAVNGMIVKEIRRSEKKPWDSDEDEEETK